MLLAVDDTDGPDGGCTTHVAHRIAEALGPEALAEPAHLVRLWPKNPHKTRGNAAVVLPLETALDPDTILDRAFEIVRRHAHLADGKGAGLALFDQPPAEAWYRQGVQGPVDLEAARTALDQAGVPTRELGTGRGLVGCLCAAAWRPGALATYELITYRQRRRWGTPRQVEAASVRRVQAAFEPAFDCHDPATGHLCMVPRTPCPVLHGLRATARAGLLEASRSIEAEPAAGRRLFVTNQASDDHLPDASLEPLTVQATPEALPGGHVKLVGQTTEGHERTCMAFEPTGDLRKVALAVQPGDRVLALGSVADDQVNLEKLLHAPARHRVQQACPGCGRSMSSAGRDAGVRCTRCGHRAPKRFEQPAPTWHEAPASARRHLARPLTLGLAPRVAKAADALGRAAAPTPSVR